ncbi:hypothetical protein BJY52DRAFT_1232474 [Lactarius psammicola]|nr:hypothetical protein BJY52DRAFT_1232474 [Lactarius psammicola]
MSLFKRSHHRSSAPKPHCTQRERLQTEGGSHIDSFNMLAALGISASTPVSVTQTLVDCLKEDVQRKLQQWKHYESDMLERPTKQERSRRRPPGGLRMVRTSIWLSDGWGSTIRIRKARGVEVVRHPELKLRRGLTLAEARRMLKRRRSCVMASRERRDQVRAWGERDDEDDGLKFEFKTNLRSSTRRLVGMIDTDKVGNGAQVVTVRTTQQRETKSKIGQMEIKVVEDSEGSKRWDGQKGQLDDGGDQGVDAGSQ